MTTIELKTTVELEVKYLQAECGVRHWEDASVNGADAPEDGEGVPFKKGDTWAPLIDLDNGDIVDWPQGTTMEAHFKVCDDGVYSLLDADRKVVKSIDGYVPDIMSPGGSGYGDYVIMNIGADGKIADWCIDLTAFEEAEG